MTGVLTTAKRTTHAVIITHRVKATLGYNIAYFLILLALLGTTEIILNAALELAILFAAVFLLKTQASLADVIHDYEVDRQNPEKRVLADAVDYIGRSNLWTLTALEIAVSMLLWGVMTVMTGEYLFIFIGALGIALGFTYSYPPRIKERGVLNHIVTSGVDVMVVIYPAGFLLMTDGRLEHLPVMVLVFAYSFAYHVAHQAADTYYDREANISTFTQDIGLEQSVLVIVAFFLIAAGIAFYYWLLLAAFVLACTAGWFSYLYTTMANKNEQEQTDYLAQKFNIALIATGLNTIVALNLFYA